MDGYELVARIREIKPEAKIICMSGFAEEKCPEGVIFLERPFSIEVLRTYVDEIFTRTS